MPRPLLSSCVSSGGQDSGTLLRSPTATGDQRLPASSRIAPQPMESVSLLSLLRSSAAASRSGTEQSPQATRPSLAFVLSDLSRIVTPLSDHANEPGYSMNDRVLREIAEWAQQEVPAEAWEQDDTFRVVQTIGRTADSGQSRGTNDNISESSGGPLKQ